MKNPLKGKKTKKIFRASERHKKELIEAEKHILKEKIANIYPILGNMKEKYESSRKDITDAHQSRMDELEREKKKLGDTVKANLKTIRDEYAKNREKVISDHEKSVNAIIKIINSLGGDEEDYQEMIKKGGKNGRNDNRRRKADVEGNSYTVRVPSGSGDNSGS